MTQRICTGCAVQLAEQDLTSFCSNSCRYEFEFSEAYANHVYRLMDAGFYGAFDDTSKPK